ncbi:MAG: Cache 3/Cache 2 fusion domain-containing protein [Thermodesulfovibrionales bacterium]|nr:Cache 3/Cache 2 fusion domain-containing protein [Thermodesulfovibrionales bacterium]
MKDWHFWHYDDLKIKWKILFLVLPLVIILIISVGTIIGSIATHQAHKGITETSMADLDHMAEFTRDLLITHNMHIGKPEENKEAFEHLKSLIKSKKVGKTGYIYCMDITGTLTIHPAREGDNIYDATDFNGFPFIKEMTEKREGWIRYPWKNPDEKEARMKIVRYIYYEPWQWIIAVGSYETEFYHEASLIKNYIFTNMISIILVSIMISIILVFWASSTITAPIKNMMEVVRKIRGGKLNERIHINSKDEIGELAQNFNSMVEILEKQKEMEKTLNQNQKMASLGILASEVAHEINNPLGIILGYASYMEEKIPKDEPTYKFLIEMKKESQRCKKIIENFLNFAKIPEPTFKLNDLNSVIDDIINFASNHPDLHNIKIKKEFNENIPKLMFDEDQIKQVAINLILNAAAALKNEGELFIKTDFGDDGYVNIVFEDKGIGIPPEDLDRIFEPFFTTKTKGTGLGLAVTKQIIKQHLGDISVESAVGVGTKFTISLPIKR